MVILLLSLGLLGQAPERGGEVPKGVGGPARIHEESRWRFMWSDPPTPRT